LLADLRPRYGLTDDPRRTAIIGASYGACNAVYTALEASDIFGLVGSMSFAYLRGSPIRRRMRGMRRLPFRRLYVDHGTAWSARERRRHDNDPASRDLVRIAEERGMIHGLDLRYVVGRGHFHDEPAWRKRLPGCLEFLLGA
jgi:predicted alpha/beta superfamily hydrolase